MTKLEEMAFIWASNESGKATPPAEEFYCPTRDIFQARIDKMLRDAELFSKLKQEDTYIISAMAGEIGNNSFDHNLGNWPDVPGIFFGYRMLGGGIKIVLADRGRGILGTLKKVLPHLESDSEAIKVAFTQKISGRAPENRGNGLKFVKENIQSQKAHLSFFSGSGQLELNEDFEIADGSKKIFGCLAILTV